MIRENADRRRGRPFTLDDQVTLDPGYYWILRCEPDGPPEWEVARFVRGADGEYWLVKGSPRKWNPTRNAFASNAWRIDDRVDERDLRGAPYDGDPLG